MNKTINKKLIALILVFGMLLTGACKYIVLPAGLEEKNASATAAQGWSAWVTGISQTGDGVHLDLTLRNETGAWSEMHALEDKEVTLTAGGQTASCGTVFISSGGHRLAPGFQMRGYTGGVKAEPETQLIYVECAGVQDASGGTLTIPYTYVTGQYNYYEQDKNRVNDKLEVDVEVVSGLEYPITEPVDGLVYPQDVEIVALNKVVLTLENVEHNVEGFQFHWMTNNPGEYPSYVHIGNPPVIGDDGILYGYYETPDIVSAPITPAGGTAEWDTQVTVPEGVSGFYILLSVESGKARLFDNYALDISGE